MDEAFIKKTETAKSLTICISDPLEIKCYTVPILKGLINGKNTFGGQERGSALDSKILM